MANISVPRTPSPITGERASSDKEPFSPTLHAIGELTPPPSSQMRRPTMKSPPARTQPNPLASPPTTSKTIAGTKPTKLFGEVPNLDSVQNLSEEQLRGVLSEALPALTEARMAAAHAKLQHKLLSIEKSEYIQRAEVEHEMIRREVKVLQEGRPDHGGPASSPRSPQSTAVHLDLALKRCNELQRQNIAYEQKLRKAKKYIMVHDGEVHELKSENKLLRDRIRDNRDHFNAMRSSGTLSINGTPLPEYRTPLHRTPKTPGATQSKLNVDAVGSQDAFNALLKAGQVMSTAANSVPSTPTRASSKKLHHSHMRGSHSMSSLPTTPKRPKEIAHGTPLATPIEHRTPRLIVPTPSAQLTYEDDERHHTSRDSTISASESGNEAYDNDNVEASQASQKATSMLRRERVNAAGRKSIISPPSTQGKLAGQVKKPGYEKSRSTLKRSAESSPYGEGRRRTKKAKLSQSQVGLGIRDWSNPAH